MNRAGYPLAARPVVGPPKTAFFLFGPRGTGKSTWIGENFADAHVVDLLPPEVMLRYQRTPAAFREEVPALPRDRWIVVDEAQRVPKLIPVESFLERLHSGLVLG